MILPVQRRSIQIAVLATPFGFGPASKAYNIGQVLSEDYGASIHYFGTESAREFFHAQKDLRVHALDAGSLEAHPRMLSSYDAIINVLAPELVTTPHIAAATYYVDSLGFMWQPADLPQDHLLRQVRAYFAQDLFGSVANLRRLGLPRVRPVSGIVSPTSPATGRTSTGRPRALVNLGGLSNPAGTGSGHAYLPLVERLLRDIRDEAYVLSIAMNPAEGVFTLNVDGAVRHLSQAGFQAELANCDLIFSSPGVTTLIEASQAGRPYVPLPPQNWSQVVVCRHMARSSEQDIWKFMADKYTMVDPYAKEAVKAAAVREINRQLAESSRLVRDYGELARRAVRAREVPRLCAPYRGAQEVAAAVAADLGLKRNSYISSEKVEAQ